MLQFCESTFSVWHLNINQPFQYSFVTLWKAFLSLHFHHNNFSCTYFLNMNYIFVKSNKRKTFNENWKLILLTITYSNKKARLKGVHWQTRLVITLSIQSLNITFVQMLFIQKGFLGLGKIVCFCVYINYALFVALFKDNTIKMY